MTQRDHLIGQRLHRPFGLAIRRVAASHRDQMRLASAVQLPLLTRAWSIIERLQAALYELATRISDRRHGAPHNLGNLLVRLALPGQQQRVGTPDRPRTLLAAGHQLQQRALLILRKPNRPSLDHLGTPCRSALPTVYTGHR